MLPENSKRKRAYTRLLRNSCTTSKAMPHFVCRVCEIVVILNLERLLEVEFGRNILMQIFTRKLALESLQLLAAD
jgi:hypothetical protein